MRYLRFSMGAVLGVLILTVLSVAGTPGSFRGKIVENASSSPADKNWIYVQGRNGMVRRVEISHAHIEYDEDVPASDRSRTARQALVPGAEVRVTAEQGSDGEWKASEIEILEPAAVQPSADSTQRSAQAK